MITIVHEASGRTVLRGSKDSFQQIGGMIRQAADQGTGATVRIIAQAIAPDGGTPTPAFLRITLTEDPVCAVAIGKDLLVKGTASGILGFCGALESIVDAERLVLEAPAGDSRALAVSVAVEG